MREGGRESERERERRGEREGGREGGRESEREGGREGGKELVLLLEFVSICPVSASSSCRVARARARSHIACRCLWPRTEYRFQQTEPSIMIG